MRTLRLLAAAGTALVLTACGSVTGPGPGSSGDADGSSPSSAAPDGTGVDGTVTIVDPAAELVATGMVMQRSEDAEPELCVGGVAESYPPQCGGPVLKGEFNWDDVEVEKASGVTWTNEAYWAVGHLDRSGEGMGTFTLSRPLSADPPEGFTPPTHEDAGFPQLCEDPTADVPEVDQADRTSSGKGMEEEQRLIEVAQGLDGYVTMWLSDGGPTMNVVLNEQGDLKLARTELRRVFSGPLCLEKRDLPTEQDVQAAQEALSERWEELGLMGSGGGGVSGLLEVQTLVADRATVDAIHQAVAEWLTPEQVVISSTFRELAAPDQ